MCACVYVCVCVCTRTIISNTVNINDLIWSTCVLHVELWRAGWQGLDVISDHTLASGLTLSLIGGTYMAALHSCGFVKFFQEQDKIAIITHRK